MLQIKPILEGVPGVPFLLRRLIRAHLDHATPAGIAIYVHPVITGAIDCTPVMKSRYSGSRLCYR